jgi:hypothetical protein
MAVLGRRRGNSELDVLHYYGDENRIFLDTYMKKGKEV